MNKKKIFSILSNVVLTMLIVISSFLLIRNTCFTAVIVSGNSMNPTLKNNEFGYAAKTKYALNHIERFDIIVFSKQDEGKDLIKRVIGLPGEVIEFKGENCDLYVNGLLVEQSFINIDYQKVTCDNLAEGFEKDKPFTLEENYYFVLGDNRGNSRDSLHGLGLIEHSSIIGVLSFINSSCDTINNDGDRVVCEGKTSTGYKFFR